MQNIGLHILDLPYKINNMVLNRDILEERELLDIGVTESRKINNTLASGLFIGAILSTLPPMVMPLKIVNREGVCSYQYRDSNVGIYSIFLGYFGIIIPFTYLERSKKRDSLCSEIERFYMQEDGII